MLPTALLVLALCVLLMSAFAASDVEQRETFAWVPTNGCFLCYEGAEEGLKKVAKYDPVNPCRLWAQVKKGTCASFGWKRALGKDPVFHSVTLWTNKQDSSSTWSDHK